MKLEDICKIVGKHNVFRAHYDTEDPAYAPIQNEIVAFLLKGKMFLHPEVSSVGMELVRAAAGSAEVHRAPYGTEYIFDALDKGQISTEQAAAQLFAAKVSRPGVP